MREDPLDDIGLLDARDDLEPAANHKKRQAAAREVRGRAQPALFL